MCEIENANNKTNFPEQKTNKKAQNLKGSLSLDNSDPKRLMAQIEKTKTKTKTKKTKPTSSVYFFIF